tara:strand:- start:14313 stop:18128 length:3816 start_codon:yes stop_codon:yes gene_type:complete
MKLFERENENFLQYIRNAILSKRVELECIFGSKPSKNPIDKRIFLSLMDKCKENYHLIEETTNLDIRHEFRNNVSNIRCTINGIDSIKRYCHEDSLENIEDENITFIQKQYYKDHSNPTKKYNSLQDLDYNVRLNLKTENILSKDHKFIKSFLTDFKDKKKHFRYKKRISFLTLDKIFRIDLTVVKSTKYSNGKYDFQKTFRQANVLKNYEQYEMEIEYIGWKENVGVEEIDQLYNHFNTYFIPGPGKEVVGNIYDPLNMGIKIFMDEKEEEILFDEEYNYDYESPRYTENTIVEDSENIQKYQDLIGKYVKIKDSYFSEVNNDFKLRDSLKEYYQKGIHLSIVKEISEYTETGIEVLIEFIHPIGGYHGLTLPVKYLYNTPTFTPLQSELLDDEDDTVEGELPSKRPDEGNKEAIIQEISKKVGDILESHVIDITKMIYNSDTIISHQLKENIIQKYKSFTDQNMKPYSFTFMAPQPVTLTIDYLKLNNPRSILKDYAVTEKADGERYQMIIVDHKGYLINSKKNVIDMNVVFKDYKDGWLFDGEYITRDKENKPIQLFMIFDIYLDEMVSGKITPQPIHSYPFISRNPGDISRSSIIQKFFSEGKSKKVDKEKKSIRISAKQYEFGYLTSSSEEEIKKSEDITGIFRASELILKREKEGYYNYRIDGLIYLPVRYSVRGSIEGLQSKNISGTWNYNFKWKPPEENTIDFLVKVKKTVEDSKVVDQILPLIEMDGGVKTMYDYKQLEMYVGYDELEDDKLDYCRLVLEGGVKKVNKDKERIKIFNHHSEEIEKYNTSNIKLTNGKMLCLNYDQEEIKDGDLVEMRFNKDANNGAYWEPLRLRSDKKNPQYFTVANNVWSTILDPITSDMIQGDYDIETIVEEKSEDSGKYYVGDNELQYFESNKLKKLHNYIKSKLIIGVCSSFKKPIKIMDLSFGQGGDTQKYINDNFKCSFFVGIDISSNIDEACRRFYSANKNTKGVLFRADTSKNIKNGECASIEGITEKERSHTETMISILYGENKPIPKEYEKIKKRYNSLSVPGFDVISSQFSMHYYFKNRDTFNGFLNNLRENIKKEGYFIGTCYDGKKIYNHFQSINDKMRKVWYDGYETNDTEDTEDTEEYEEYKTFKYMDNMGNDVFSIEKKYDLDNFDYKKGFDENIFGNEIEVFMDSIGQPIIEYLVNFDFFIDVMKENGFELINPRGTTTNLFHNKYFEDGLGQFHKVIEHLPEIKKNDHIFRKFYSEAFEMNSGYHQSPLNTLSSFNTYFIFQKI